MFRVLNRRDFLALTGATAATALSANRTEARSVTISDIFAERARCRSLLVGDVRRYALDERMMFFAFQGLVNRKRPQLYLISTPDCEQWLEYYRERFGVTHERTSSPYRLLNTFGDEIQGYRIYDPDNLHTFNVAATMAGLDHALPVHPDYIIQLQRAGLKKVDDLRGKFRDRYDAYQWSVKNLLPHCSQRVVANLCMDWPEWPSGSVEAVDFFVQLGALQVDCSSARGHPRDIAILRSIYERLEKPACLVGWHCARDHEHEAVLLAAGYGVFAICNLSSPNYSIHPSVRPSSPRSYSQPLPNERLERAKKVEPKVYLANLQTDGDAAWAMTNMYNGKWPNPERGLFPMNWSIMTSAYYLCPALLQYYYETRTDDDYLICGPSGIAYTYPHLHPDPIPFLRMTREAMNRCGLRVMNLDAWNRNLAWRGVHPHGFFDLLRKELPEALGFVRGMGEAAFEPSVLDEGAPIVYCGEAIHIHDNPYDLLKTFADACPNRPLFVFCYVNHNITLGQMLDGFRRWPAEFELLRLDEFMIKLRTALDAGIIQNDLYPEKAGIREILKRDTQPMWREVLEKALELAGLAEASRRECLVYFGKEIGGCDDQDLEAAFQFALCFRSADMIQKACESRGVYVGNRRKGLEDFHKLYQSVPDKKILRLLADWWDAWDDKSFHTLSELQRTTADLVRVARWLEKVNDGWKPL